VRIGMVLENSFPPDIRVEKELRALAIQGHEVTLLCACKGDQPAEDTFGKARIIRFQPQAFGNKITKRLDILYCWLTGRKRAWEVAIEQFVSEHHIQALHVHDLPLVPAGLAAARKSQIPLVFDMHEIYPIMIRDRIAASSNGVRTRIHTGLHNALFSPRWWDRVEQRAVEEADRIIVVVEESKQRLERMSIDGDKIAVVLNAEDIDHFLGLPEHAEVASEYRDDFLVGYVGGVDSPIRGLDNLVKAWPRVLQRIPNARLLIVGDGGVRPAIEAMVRDLNLTERVTFAGWVSFNEVAAYIKALDVAVIPHAVNEHTNHTIPHKLFQYLAMGKLVVSSDIGPIRRILQDTQGGIIAAEYSPQGFADAIVEAHQRLRSGRHDPVKQLEVLSRKYGFKALAEPLLNLYQDLNG
jgi:glycosyltransferase involved in cell wall biosynthesis